MRDWHRILSIIALLTAAGCAPQEDTTQKAAPASATAVLRSVLDDGPRAAEGPIDELMAVQGETLFKDKGCSACHAFGRRVTGPDLAGVTMRRTAKWMEQQILHPDKMVKEDSIARALLAQYALQMPNQGLTEIEARTVIEFLKHNDHESAEADD
jgi:cytochrome c551/c552